MKVKPENQFTGAVKKINFVCDAWHAWNASSITKLIQASFPSVLCFLIRPGHNVAALALIAAAHRAKVAGLKVLLFFLGEGSIATVTFRTRSSPKVLTCPKLHLNFKCISTQNVNYVCISYCGEPSGTHTFSHQVMSSEHLDTSRPRCIGQGLVSTAILTISTDHWAELAVQSMLP